MGIFPKHVFLVIRRLAAFAYDSFLLFSVVFILGAAAIALNGGHSVNPLLFSPITVLTSMLFFSWFWVHGGQTLGMRAWQLKLTDTELAALTWKKALIRSAIMLLSGGIGTLWVLFNKDGQSLQDIFSGTIMHKNQKKK